MSGLRSQERCQLRFDSELMRQPEFPHIDAAYPTRFMKYLLQKRRAKYYGRGCRA
jgi:hypothetical protein